MCQKSASTKTNFIMVPKPGPKTDAAWAPLANLKSYKFWQAPLAHMIDELNLSFFLYVYRSTAQLTYGPGYISIHPLATRS